jgi:hypothetical protein
MTSRHIPVTHPFALSTAHIDLYNSKVTARVDSDRGSPALSVDPPDSLGAYVKVYNAYSV